MVVFHKDVLAAEAAPGIERRMLAHDGGLMACEFSFRKGAAVGMHTHRHEQVTYVISGRFEATLDGETVILGPGDSMHAGPDVPHGVVALEDTLSLDVFTPQREDYV